MSQISSNLLLSSFDDKICYYRHLFSSYKEKEKKDKRSLAKLIFHDLKKDQENNSPVPELHSLIYFCLFCLFILENGVWITPGRVSRACSWILCLGIIPDVIERTINGIGDKTHVCLMWGKCLMHCSFSPRFVPNLSCLQRNSWREYYLTPWIYIFKPYIWLFSPCFLLFYKNFLQADRK